jgi:hypothetical protein
MELTDRRKTKTTTSAKNRYWDRKKTCRCVKCGDPVGTHRTYCYDCVAVVMKSQTRSNLRKAGIPFIAWPVWLQEGAREEIDYMSVRKAARR